jgi:DnaK suppressor protein
MTTARKTTPGRKLAPSSQVTPARRRELERELRNERARVERSMAARMGVDGAGLPFGTVPRAAADAEGGIAVALETRVLARHEAVVDALRRLEAGTYGICVSCQGPIPYGRLAVMPEATHCVPCGAGRDSSSRRARRTSSTVAA